MTYSPIKQFSHWLQVNASPWDPNSPSYRPPAKDQCDYMDRIDRKAVLAQIEALREVRFRMQQAISAARAKVDDGDEIVRLLESALHDSDIDGRIIRLDEACA